MSQSFDQWLDEIEVFSTRRERAMDDLGPNYEKWLLSAWQGGMWCADSDDQEFHQMTDRGGAPNDH